MKEIILLS